ncbi:uncharacterized protein BDW43DRAFT_308225 [Aspergillus alliaceus]|uniref:uncharacterized protein n=1 Tax=Petromyces alliaceus TaxID=209559 RepID=UPI0012A5EFBA|nr:uncharacterized protein BDW43DRAFT_308225 [Aspergillus alliaceus]KAB8236548.1 hypothetical protein BDW43DRAFT_308225 [Aspergillus alliaceus]
MKSPLYILTALLPLAVQVAQATPVAESDADDSIIEERSNCKVNHGFDYWKYPCDSSDRTGHANKGDNVDFQCRYKNWYKTPRGWVRQSDKPNSCRSAPALAALPIPVATFTFKVITPSSLTPALVPVPVTWLAAMVRLMANRLAFTPMPVPVIAVRIEIIAPITHALALVPVPVTWLAAMVRLMTNRLAFTPAPAPIPAARIIISAPFPPTLALVPVPVTWLAAMVHLMTNRLAFTPMPVPVIAVRIEIIAPITHALAMLPIPTP